MLSPLTKVRHNYGEGYSFQGVPVQLAGGRFGLGLGPHFDKSESTRTARLVVGSHIEGFDRAVPGKELLQLSRRRGKWKPTYQKCLVTHVFLALQEGFSDRLLKVLEEEEGVA